MGIDDPATLSTFCPVARWQPERQLAWPDKFGFEFWQCDYLTMEIMLVGGFHVHLQLSSV
jgi:hypothetical protein